MLPSIDKLNQSSFEEFSSAVANLFENSPHLSQILYTKRPFKSYQQIISEFTTQMKTLPKNEIHEILSAHPRIGQITNLSASSSAEQTRQHVSPETLLALKEWNEKYEAKHGLKFVVFVNGRSRDAILDVLKERFENESDEEMQSGIQAMASIALDRLGKSK